MSARPASATARHRHARGLALLAVSMGVVAFLTAFASASAWPLVVLPVLAAFPLAGAGGLGFALVASAVLLATVAGRPGAPAATLAVGWLAFGVGATLVAARHTKVRRDLERVQGASLRDRLTGLHNFAFFSDTLRRETQRATRYGGPLSLVLFDLDAFKSFNDTYGHEAGNRLLAEVGRAIDASRRSADVAARFGGEEFALLVPGDPSEAVEAAERIRAAVVRIVVDVGKGMHDGRTISAGVAGYRRGDPPDLLLESADRALYLSKRRGRNRVSVSGDTGLARAAGA